MVRRDDPPSDDALIVPRRRRWTIERWLLVLTFMGTLVIGVFGLGVQWNEMTSIKANVTAINAALRQDYVRADVYAADQRRYAEAIDRLTAAVERLSTPDPRVPRFGPQ